MESVRPLLRLSTDDLMNEATDRACGRRLEDGPHFRLNSVAKLFAKKTAIKPDFRPKVVSGYTLRMSVRNGLARVTISDETSFLVLSGPRGEADLWYIAEIDATEGEAMSMMAVVTSECARRR